MTSHQLINATSGAVEYFTPVEYTDAAREVMGSIELDPASCRAANEFVKANDYFTKDQDGLSREWKANTLFMNHPFHKGENACPLDRSKCKKLSCIERGYHIDERIPGNADWINKLVSEYENWNCRQACCITFAATSEEWFRPLLLHPICFIHGRVNYRLPDGSIMKGVTKGSCITYFGLNTSRFKAIFSRFGTVKD